MKMTAILFLVLLFTMSSVTMSEVTLTCEKGMNYTGDDDLPPVQILDSREALCDPRTDGGGWIIIQRRTKGDVDFYRGWEDYKRGFGNITTDHWLGLDAIHELTSSGYTELRVDMEIDLSHRFLRRSGHKYAQYSIFEVGDEKSNYELKVHGFTGDAFNGLAYHYGRPFTTKDKDNDPLYDGNCAVDSHGGWWYGTCYQVNLNGKWGKMTWVSVLNPGYLTSSEMKIRRP